MLHPRAPASRAALRLRASGGFTLIELIVTIAISGILISLVAPSFASAFLSNRLAAFSNSFAASAQLARSEAVKRNSPVTICRSTNGTSCVTTGSFQQGWIVFSDPNANGAVDTGETVVQVQEALASDYHFTSTAYPLIFQPSGIGATAATLTLCRALPSPGPQERTITVSAVGRTTVTRTTTGVCT